MNKLFKDSETFQKERPTKITEKQQSRIYKEISEEIISYNLSKKDKKDIISDIIKCSEYNSEPIDLMNSFKNDCFGYTLNADFLYILESIEDLEREYLLKNVKDWVKAHDIKPKHKIGDSFKLKKPICYGYSNGDVIFITNIYKDRASYTISLDKDKKGGTVVSYESLENCI